MRPSIRRCGLRSLAAILALLALGPAPLGAQASYLSAKAARALSERVQAELAAKPLRSERSEAPAQAEEIRAKVLEAKRDGSLPYIVTAISEKARSGDASVPELLFLISAGLYAPIEMDIARGALALAAREAGLELAAAAYLVQLVQEGYGSSIGYRMPLLADHGILTVAQFAARWADVESYLADPEDALNWIDELVAASEYALAAKTVELAVGMDLIGDSYARMMRRGIAELAAAAAARAAEATARAEAAARAAEAAAAAAAILSNRGSLRVEAPLGAFALLKRDGQIVASLEGPGLIEELATGDYEAESRLSGLPDQSAVLAIGALAETLWRPWTMGYIKMESEPEGASVFIDGAFAGSTPGLFPVAPGARAVMLSSPKRLDYSVVLVVAPGELRRPIGIVLEPKGGSLYVETEPAGMVLSLDGSDFFTSPYLFEGLKPGAYSVTVYDLPADDRIYAGAILETEVRSDETTTISKKLELGKSKLRIIDFPVGATVRIRGKDAISENASDAIFESTVDSGLVESEVRFGGKVWSNKSYVLVDGVRWLSPSDMTLFVSPPVASIKIDGKGDDWTGIDPILEDPSGDCKADYSGSDIVKAYIARDEKNLYWRLDFAEGKPASYPTWREWTLQIESDPGQKIMGQLLMLSVAAAGMDGTLIPRIRLMERGAMRESSLLRKLDTGSFRTGKDFIEVSFPQDQFMDALSAADSYSSSFHMGDSEYKGYIDETRVFQTVLRGPMLPIRIPGGAWERAMAAPDGGPIRGIAFLGGSTWLASGSRILYKLSSKGKAQSKYDLPFEPSALCVPDGAIHVLDKSGAPMRRIGAMAATDSGFAMVDGRFYAASSSSRALSILDAEGGTMTSFAAPIDGPLALGFDGTCIWVAGGDGYVYKAGL